MKKYTFFTLLLFTLFTFISCFAVDFFSTEVEISGVEWEIPESQRKLIYDKDEIIDLKFSFSPDFNKFREYELYLWVLPEGTSNEIYDAILIEPKKYLKYDSNSELSDSKILETFNLTLKKEGNYRILTCLSGSTKIRDGNDYLTWKYLFFTVE